MSFTRLVPISSFTNGFNSNQFNNDVRAISGPGKTIDKIFLGLLYSEGDSDLTLLFLGTLTQADNDEIDNLVSNHMADPVGWDQFKFKNIDSSDSPYEIRRRSVLCDTSSGDITVILPTLNRTVGSQVGIRKTNSANTLTVTTPGSEKIDGADTYALTANGETIILENDGNEWTSGATPMELSQNMARLDITSHKGEIVVDDGYECRSLLPGGNGHVLQADDTQNLGVKWSKLPLNSIEPFNVSSLTSGDILKFNGSEFTAVQESVAASATLPLVTVRQPSGYTLGTSFANMIYSLTDHETDNTILEHSSTNTDRIDIKEDGYYRVSFACAHISTNTWNQIYGRVMKNGATVIAGSETWGAGYNSGSFYIQSGISHDVDVYLNNGDYVTVQYRVVNSANTLYDNTLSVLKLDGVQGNPGPQGADGDIVWQGVWQPQFYTVNQAVTHLGTSYVCKLNHTNQIPPDATYWDVLASKGDQGDNGPTGPTGPTGLVDWQGAWTSQNYTLNQSVSYQGSSYICIADTDASQPPTNTGYWELTSAKGDTGTPGAGSSIIIKDNNVDLANTPHTSIDFSGTGFTVSDEGSGVAKVTISGIFGSEYTYAEDDTLSQTTSATFVQKLRLTTGNIPAGTYRIGWSYQWRFSSVSSSGFIGQIQVDDDAQKIIHSFRSREYDYSASVMERSASGFKHIALTSGVHTIDLDYNRNNGGTAYIWNTRIELWRVA